MIHHIIPKHAGGTNDPSNLVELTVEEHAAAHKALYDQHGREQDRMAWLALSGQITKQEVIQLGCKLGRKLTDEYLEKTFGKDWKRQLGLRGGPASQRMGVGIYNPKKRAEYALIGAKAAGKANIGKVWITDGNSVRKIPKEQPLPDGFRLGRK